jgi:hypothetical protein
LVIISYTTGLSFAKERIGPLVAIITTVFYLLALYLFALSNTYYDTPPILVGHQPPLVGHRCHTPPDEVALTSQQGSPAGRLDTPKQEAIYQDLAAIKPSLVAVIVGAQATMPKPCIACHVRQPPRSLDGSKVFKTTPQRRKAT